MSFRFPDFNSEKAGNLAVRANLGTSCSKPANTGSTTIFWFRTRDFDYDANVDHMILGRDGGLTGGSDAYVRIPQNSSTLNFAFRNGGGVLVSNRSISIAKGKVYMVLVSANADWVHFAACEPGGTAIIAAATANTTLFSTAFTSPEMWETIASTSNASLNPYYGPVEEFNFYYGSFPESSAGVPDAATIESLAAGTLDPASLVSSLVQGTSSNGNAHRVRYRMRDETDLADALGLRGNMTITYPAGATEATGGTLFTSGPLRPTPLMPAFTRDCISQVVFGTPGDDATATATIRTEGGTYTGITPTSIQARLLNKAQTVIRDWTTVDAAPTGGTWAANANAFTGVVMQDSYLRVEFRALDGVGATLATETGYGLRGAGFHAITQGQSQLMYLFENASSLALTSGVRAVSITQADATAPTQWAMLSSGNTNGRAVQRGIRQMINEINNLHPGVPIQVDSYGQSGTAIDLHIGVGIHAGRPAALAATLGVVQPYYMMFVGHSESSDSNYQTRLGSLVTNCETNLGAAIKNLHVSVPRYKNAGTDDQAGGNANQVHWSRRGARDYCIANPTRNMWMGSWSTVLTGEDVANTGLADPHPSPDATGQGRTGTGLAWALMSACRAVPDVPLGISRVRADGSDAVIEFGAVNP